MTPPTAPKSPAYIPPCAKVIRLAYLINSEVGSNNFKYANAVCTSEITSVNINIFGFLSKAPNPAKADLMLAIVKPKGPIVGSGTLALRFCLSFISLCSSAYVEPPPSLDCLRLNEHNTGLCSWFEKR